MAGLSESEKQITGGVTEAQKRELVTTAVSYFVDQAVQHKVIRTSNNHVDNIIRYIDSTSSINNLYKLLNHLANHES